MIYKLCFGMRCLKFKGDSKHVKSVDLALRAPNPMGHTGRVLISVR